MIKFTRILMMLFLLLILASLGTNYILVPIFNKRTINNNAIIFEKIIKDNCTKYYDGCNTCSGGFCTMMACSVEGKAYCIEYDGKIF